jgi:LPXTG-motif cell wall-anchored protein
VKAFKIGEAKNMKRTPASVSATLILISLNAAFWLIYAIIVALGAHPALPSTGIIKWVLFILALGTSVVLAVIVFFLRKHNRFAFYIGVALLAIIAVLILLDEIGAPDIAILLVNLVTLGLLLKDRAWYIQKGDSDQQAS